MARESMRRRAAKRFGFDEQRLADMVASLTEANLRYYKGAYLDIVELMIAAATNVPLIEATDACRLFDGIVRDKGRPKEEGGTKFWNIAPDDIIPNAAPPFEMFWIERKSDETGLRNGALFQSSRRDDGDWLVSAIQAQQVDRDKVFVYPAVVRCVVSPAGRIESELQMGWMPEDCLPTVSPDTKAEQAPWILKDVMRLMFGICFLHCRNVTTKPTEPDAAINRERKKGGLKPLLRYSTIDIEPMKRVLRTEGQLEKVGLKKALHICRGHFATYTPEKPLFGRTVGTFWVPQHLRGSADEGVVVGDYRVKAPAAPQQREAP